MNDIILGFLIYRLKTATRRALECSASNIYDCNFTRLFCVIFVYKPYQYDMIPGVFQTKRLNNANL